MSTEHRRKLLEHMAQLISADKLAGRLPAMKLKEEILALLEKVK
jgi:hypothetical protein